MDPQSFHLLYIFFLSLLDLRSSQPCDCTVFWGVTPWNLVQFDRAVFDAWFFPGYFLRYFPILKLWAIHYPLERRLNFPEEITLHIHCVITSNPTRTDSTLKFFLTITDPASFDDTRGKINWGFRKFSMSCVGLQGCVISRQWPELLRHQQAVKRMVTSSTTSDVDRNDINRHHILFHYTKETKTGIAEMALNTQKFPSVRQPVRGVSHIE